MKETKLEIPDDCEVDKIETQDGHVVVTFREKKRKLPKSWEEFCEMYPIKDGECLIENYGEIEKHSIEHYGRYRQWDNLLPDRATAEAVLALCQLIQLRNCYNGDWVPDWTDEERKYTIDFYEDKIWCGDVGNTPCTLHFKSKELRDEFLRNFRPLIEKNQAAVRHQGRRRRMSAAWFFVGALVGMFIILSLAWLSIVIERRQKKKYEDYHRRFIQAQVDWILAHQPTDEEIRNMFSPLVASKGEDYNKMFENCEVNEKVGDVCGDNRFETIDAAKKDLLESTNIDTSPDEMKVLDNFLFRCWQMGWLEKYEKGGEQ